MGSKRCCHVQKCCGFLDLERASIVIGTFTLVISCIGVATLSRNLALEQDEMASRILSKAATIDSTRLEATIAYIRWGSVGLLLVGIACLFSSVGLIWAIKRKEITYVVPWIASHLIYTLYNIIITSIAAFKLYTWQVPYHHLYIACMLIWDGGMLILLYFIAVVKSYYYQVKRQKRREANGGGGGLGGGCSTSSFRVRSNCSSSNAACSPCDNFSYQLPPEQFSPQINNHNSTDNTHPPGAAPNGGVPSPISDNNDSSTTPSAPVQRDLSEYRYFCPPSAPPAPPYSTVEPPPYSAVADSPVIASPPPSSANLNPVRLPSGTQTLPRLDGGTHSNRNTSPITLIGSALLNNYSTCDRNVNVRGVAPCRVNRGASLSRNSPQDDNNNFAGWGSNAGVRFPPRRQNSVPANEIFRSSGMGRYYEDHRDRFFKYP